MRGPSGTVTLLFTDIEGSTRLWEEHPAEMRAALAIHDAVMRRSVENAHGYVFKTVGDAFCVAFSTALDGVAGARAAQQAIRDQSWPEHTPIRVRMALHTGSCEERDDDYFGPTVNRTARLEAIAHGGQTVLSAVTAALVDGALPDDLAVLDLGEHRLKDLGRAERVFQLCAPGLEVEFPPLRSLDNPALQNNLPAQASSFVGRTREIAELRDLVEAERLVTIVGTGGVGKTRLALQVAAEVLDGSGDGVWFVDLAPLADGALLPGAVAAALGVREQPPRPIVTTLLEVLAHQHALVILDNCEHVIDAAAKFAHAIRSEPSEVHLLATSREPLRIDGEFVYRVAPLLMPEANEQRPDVLVASDSVQLFRERMTQHDATRDLDALDTMAIARICRRLDGVPLAIELAAARARVLALPDLASRLEQRLLTLVASSRSAAARQQTIEALIDWSWELLNPAERRAFERLSAFAGSFDLDAAEEVIAGDDFQPWEAVDLLVALVDKSLIQLDDSGPVRSYRLLAAVREYAQHKLDGRGSAEVTATRSRHRDHYLAFAESAAPHLTSHDQVRWLDLLERVHDDLRAALDFSNADGGTEPALRLAVALQWLWQFRGPVLEGVRALEVVIDRADAVPAELHGRALTVLATLLIDAGRRDEGFARCQEILELAASLGSQELEAHGHFLLLWLHLRSGRLDDALNAGERALGLARHGADLDLQSRLWNGLGNTRGELGDYEGAVAAFRKARALAEVSGNQIAIGELLNNLGYFELAAGDVEGARADLSRALDVSRAARSLVVVNASLNLGLVECRTGDSDAARERFVFALEHARRVGDRLNLGYALFGLSAVESVPVVSARLLGAADAQVGSADAYERVEGQLRAELETKLCAALGRASLAALLVEGASLPQDRVIALAHTRRGKLPS